MLSTPVRVLKGHFLNIYTTIANVLAIDKTDDSIIQDYQLDTTFYKSLRKYARIYANALIDTKYYVTFINVSRTYPTLTNDTFGVYSLNAKFLNSNVSLNRSFNVTNGK